MAKGGNGGGGFGGVFRPEQKFIDRTGGKLAAARVKARGMAQGQLAAVEHNMGGFLGRQDSKLARQNRQFLGQMQRYTDSASEFGHQLVGGVRRDQAAIGARKSATGARSMPGDMAVTGRRQHQAGWLSGAVQAEAQAQNQQGKQQASIAQQAQRGYAATDKKVGQVSNSILDVLNAEQQMQNQQYMAGLKEDLMKQKVGARLSERQAQQSADLALRNSKAEALFQNNLPLAKATRQQMALDEQYKEQYLEKQVKLQNDSSLTQSLPQLKQSLGDTAALYNSAQNLVQNQGVTDPGELMSRLQTRISGSTANLFADPATAAGAQQYLKSVATNAIAGNVGASDIAQSAFQLDPTNGSWQEFYDKHSGAMDGYVANQLDQTIMDSKAAAMAGIASEPKVGTSVDLNPAGGIGVTVTDDTAARVAHDAGNVAMGAATFGLSTALQAGDKLLHIFSPWG